MDIKLEYGLELNLTVTACICVSIWASLYHISSLGQTYIVILQIYGILFVHFHFPPLSECVCGEGGGGGNFSKDWLARLLLLPDLAVYNNCICICFLYTYLYLYLYSFFCLFLFIFVCFFVFVFVFFSFPKSPPSLSALQNQ